MRHQHDVDALGIDAGGGEILQGAADRALAGLESGDAVAAVDQHQLAAGVDELRVERHRHHALRHVGGFRSGQRLFLRDVFDERIGHRERARAVVDRGAFVSADLVAIETGRLGPRRHRGARGRRAERCQGGGGAGGGGTGKRWRRVKSVMAYTPSSALRFDACVWRANVPRFRGERKRRHYLWLNRSLLDQFPEQPDTAT